MTQKDRYTNWQLLGKGGTANVYRVYDNDLEEEVAIKLLHEQYAASSATRLMLRQEILASRRLRHPYIVAMHDFYEGPQGVGAVMDIVPGATELKKWLTDNKDQLLATADQRLQLLKNIFKALHTAHEIIVHRDLKPANIMLVNGDINQPIIMDFGLAVDLNNDGPGFVGLTKKYASPEQWNQFHGIRGEKSNVTAKSDLFSMGVMAFEMFTNRIPPQSLAYRAPKTGTELKRMPARLPRPSQFCSAVPAALDGLILDLMQEDPGMRPHAASDVSRSLESITLLSAEDMQQGGQSAKRVLIPTGTFQIGSTKVDSPTEKPRRKLSMSSFYIDVNPVTNNAYREFATRTGHELPAYNDDPLLNQGDHPVVGVSWHDARLYAKWVGGSLPSEAQWEYAVKANTQNQFPWGDDEPEPTHANINLVNNGTTPVGRYGRGTSPNGLQDCCGNVWEWCEDTWSETYYKSLAHGDINPVNSAESEEKSVRGGAYNTFSSQGRCASRFHFHQDVHSPTIGFRVVYLDDGDHLELSDG